jgi:neutral amino acid transport system ATP-binding protein
MDVERTYGEVATRARQSLRDVERVPGVCKPNSILTANNIRREFGGIIAVDVDHFEVQEGSITALIGPNGAGKTTFFNLLTGFDQPNLGSWTFQGKDMSKVASHRTAAFGMVRTFQLTKSLTKLSVIENMRLGATDQKGEKWWNGLFSAVWKGQEAEITERADELLTRFQMSHMRDEYAGALSGGQRKWLAL